MFKRVHFDDLREDEIVIPFDWDTSDDFLRNCASVIAKIKTLKLAPLQSRVLSCKLDDKGVRETGRILSVRPSSVCNSLRQIGERYIKAYGEPQLYGV